MRMFKRFAVLMFCVAMCAPVALAQAQPKPVRADADVTIIIQSQQVRFITPKPGEELQLQVYDQNGALIHDSGVSFAGEINWPLLTASGEALKSGLYAYTLTRKESHDKAARVRRGHFIVDRTADRDNADKLWVTSQSDDKLGVELTAAQTENGAITGVKLPSAGGPEASPNIEKEDKTKIKTTSEMLAAALAGTVGRIAKFTSANEVGDSVISESTGLVDVNASLRVTVAPNSVNNGVVTFGTPNSEVGMTLTKDTGRADVRFDGSTLKLAAGLLGGPPGSALAVNTQGNVGIGTLAPQNRLHVGSGSSSIAASRVDAVFAGNRGDAGIAIAQNSGVNLLLQASGAGGYLGTTSNHPLIWRTNDLDRVVLAANGNLGIGTGAPAAKLHVESPGFAELAIRSTNERAILSLTNRLNPQGYTWTLESGVGGLYPSLFGIYNRNVNKSGLEIDGNLLVYVKALQITGGADFAENFDVRTSGKLTHDKLTHNDASEIQPGMVVAIDPRNPGKLNVSRRAYDRRVAGIISGAGDVKPGMMMKQEGTLADGQHPVALSGRVYVWVDATRGAVRPGDLLTSSATPGHAMKASHSARAQGAIIGKAMTELKQGKGLVLVLVTLQ